MFRPRNTFGSLAIYTGLVILGGVGTPSCYLRTYKLDFPSERAVEVPPCSPLERLEEPKLFFKEQTQRLNYSFEELKEEGVIGKSLFYRTPKREVVEVRGDREGNIDVMLVSGWNCLHVVGPCGTNTAPLELPSVTVDKIERAYRQRMFKK